MRDEVRTERTDGELLRAFRTMGDEQAFADLMRRHGQMVHNTAQALVSNVMEAEDIAQATFLALAGSGEKMEGSDSAAGWLYHVTLCLARNAYREKVRRKAREEEAAMTVTETESGTFAEGVLSTLYEELGKLAEKYRQPVILHHLEGLNYKTAAPMCGCSEQAFSMRLTRGREQLRERLARRGVALGITALVAGLGQSVSAAELPAGFVASTCAAAKGGAVSAHVSALMESAMKMLFWAKVQTVAAICAVTALVGGAGVGVAVTLPLMMQQDAPTATDQGTEMAREDARANAPARGGRVWAWGYNFYGQLGDGTKTNRAYPTPVAGLDGVIAVAAGEQHTVALKSDRRVWAWGGNSSGQLGDGTTNARAYPAAVAGLADVTAIAAAHSWYTLALKADGGVWAWGDNRCGQLGNGTTNNSPIPVPVKLADGRQLSGIIALAAGWAHSVALRNDGQVWTWGMEVGDGTNVTTRLNPVLVKLADGLQLSGINAISAGSGYTVALKSDGTLWAWGFNPHGELGDGTTISRLNPTPVKAAVDAPFSAIVAGWWHTVALRADATVWAWGSNRFGELGDGTCVDPRTTPTQVRLADGNALSNVMAVAVGNNRTLALKTDGTLVAWGKYPDTLGIGVGTDHGPLLHPMPVKLADGIPLSGITAIAAGAGQSVAIVEE